MSNEIDYLALGRRIESRRKELDLTLADVANEMDCAASTIQRYEKGRFEKVKLPMIESLARVLRVNPAWITGHTDDPTPVPEKKKEPDTPKDAELEAAGYYSLSPEKKALVDALIRSLAEGPGG